MLRTKPELSRWLSPLAVAALLVASATPVRATETLQVVTKDASAGTVAAAVQNNSADRIEAADTKAAREANDFSDATIRLNGVEVMRLKAWAGGHSPMQRARIVQERLNRASSGLNYASLNAGTQTFVADKSQVFITQTGAESVIFLRGVQLVTVTRADAAANGSNTTIGLARTWAENVRDGADASHLRGARNRADESRATPRTSDPAPVATATAFTAESDMSTKSAAR
ncbi:MAG: hypothetical protein HZB16_20505 [Armatimonadetes bacterium]|nr:hypothetical protein [Armatimonadota bacterium]